jgi:hypothetical protein
MGLDPNIILQAGQGVQPVNPLQVAGQAAALQNALIQNRSNQQTLDARQAIGPIYQQAIDPATGRLDTNKLLSGASQDPRTAWMAGDLVKAAQDRQNTQVDIDTKQYNLLKQHIGGLQQGLIGLYANPNVSQADVLRYAGQKVAEGLVSPQEMGQVLGTMPGDQAQLRPWLLNQYGQLLDADKQVDLYFGKPQQTTTGSQIQQGTESAVTGYHPQGAFTLGLSPSEQASTVATVGPNGQPGVISKGQFAAQNGVGQGGDYIPANGQPMSALTPTAPALPRAIAQGGSAAGNGAAPGFMPTDLAPGQKEALVDSANQGQAALKASSDYRMNVRPLLSEANNLIAQGVLTGPNAKAVNLAGRFASQFGIDVPNTDKADVLQKVLEQVSQRQIAAIGGNPTDAKLLSAQISTPNDKMSTSGLKAALATVEGQGQAQDLLGQAYNHYLNTTQHPIPFNQFKVAFSKDINPYVLVLRSLPKADMQRAMGAMTPQQRAEIAKDSTKLDQFVQAVGWQP